MQADMRQQPTQLNEVPWNQQTPQNGFFSKRWLQRQRPGAAAAVGSNAACSATTHAAAGKRTGRKRARCPPSANLRAKVSRQSRRPAATLSDFQRHRVEVRQRRANTRVPEAPKATAEKDERRRMVQCGSFKGADMQKASALSWKFEGFDPKFPHQ